MKNISCIRSYENFFANFANKTRFKIIIALKHKAMNVTELAEEIGEEQSKVSHNLVKLASCNIITVKQDGKNRIYSLNKETVIPIFRLIEKHVKNHCTLCDKHEN